MALAGAAGAVAAIERDVDADPVGRIRDRVAGIALDEAGDAILEVQCNAIAHIGTLGLSGSQTRWSSKT